MDCGVVERDQDLGLEPVNGWCMYVPQFGDVVIFSRITILLSYPLSSMTVYSVHPQVFGQNGQGRVAAVPVRADRAMDDDAFRRLYAFRSVGVNGHHSPGTFPLPPIVLSHPHLRPSPSLSCCRCDE